MIETFRKKPVIVDTVLWDGTWERLAEIRDWIDSATTTWPEQPAFTFDPASGLRLWNDQENCYVDCPVGHRVVKGRLGEFYPISPAAVAETYERVATDA